MRLWWAPPLALLAVACYTPQPSPCDEGERPGPYAADFENAMEPYWGNLYATDPIATWRLEDGVVKFAPPVGIEGYVGLQTKVASDLRGSRIWVEVPHMLNLEIPVQASLFLGGEAGDVFAEVTQTQGYLFGKVREAPGVEVGERAVYDPFAARFWQIRERDGTIHFEASPDGHTWHEIYSHGTLPFLQSSVVAISAGAFEIVTTDPGEVHFDNLIHCVADP